MTKPASLPNSTLLLAAVALCTCGTDPYAGDSTGMNADAGTESNLDGAGPGAGDPGQTPSTLADFLPADNEVETWVRTDPPIIVDSDTALYGLVDGGAPKYIDRGWQASAYGGYAQGGRFLQAVVHDMGAGENAEAIFTAYPATPSIVVQAQPPVVVGTGLPDAYQGQAYLGRYFIEVAVNGRSDADLDSTKAFILRILERIALLPDSGHRIIDVPMAPLRLLDLVVMIDNSPSMAPKVSKLNAQFPKLIAALRDPTDGTLPDLRIAIIDSDLGTGGAYVDNACGGQILPDGTQSIFGDLGRFQTSKSPQLCTINDGVQFLEIKAGQAVNYTGEIGSVFTCLASNLGTQGCGMEHQLQAFEFALAAKGVGNEAQQQAFLRPLAPLALVFLSDEDDCSAAPNDRLFGDLPGARGESASLRCATRAHKCNGRNLADGSPGYPTKSSFTAPFVACQARMGDECDWNTDTAGPTACNPLRSVKDFAAEMKALKDDPEKVFVAGIFGWPRSDADMATAEYKIAPVPNPNTADTQHPTVYDYWPVCYDPDHLPSAAKADPETGFDVEAAGWGATGGLRESAFIDEFGDNGMKLSICERDFSASMSRIGKAMARKIGSLCLDEKLLDTDPNTVGVQAECEVHWRFPVVYGGDTVVYGEDPVALPQCQTGATDGKVAADCWQLRNASTECPQMVTVLRTAQEKREQPQLEPGTMLRMSCRVCSEIVTEPGCDYPL